MSKHLAELCTLLVDEIYGDLASRIISTLFLYGRLPVLPLGHLSELHPRFVKNGLATLIQQRLVSFFAPDDGPTVYEANTRNAYELVRVGKATQLITARYGNQAAELVALLQDRGFVAASDILDSQSDYPGSATASKDRQPSKGRVLTNGDSHGEHGRHSHSTPLELRKEVCRQLFASKHVIQLTKDDFLSTADFNEMVEDTVKVEEYGGEVKGTKKMAEFKRSVLKRKRQWLDANTASLRLLDPSHKVRRRADLDEDVVNTGRSERSNKKRKIDNERAQNLNTTKPNTTTDASTDNRAEPLEAIFRINRDKFDVSLRSQYLEDLSARFLGETTSKVYSAILRRLEHNIPRCHDEYAEAKKVVAVDDEEGDEVGYESDEEKEVTATTMETEQELDASVDIQSVLASDKPAKVKVEVKENGYTDVDGDEVETRVNGDRDHSGINEAMIHRQKRVGYIEQHLRILSEHSFKFVNRVSSRGQGTWTVDFRALSRALAQYEIENLVTSRFGPIATRILRILHSKGKLDEKQLGSISLVRQKDLRRVLTLMQEAGFVDTQEVPRDNTRQPSRTIYLWFYDQDRCRKLVLNDTYKCMSRLLQRIRVEKEKVQPVIDKAERSDVKGQEDKYLSKAEQDALANWHETEQKLLVQLSRQDDLVAIFRDFLPLGG